MLFSSAAARNGHEQSKALEKKQKKRRKRQQSGIPSVEEFDGRYKLPKPIKQMTSKEYWNYLVKCGEETGPPPPFMR